MIDRVFGRLRVLQRASWKDQKSWLCLCDCGNRVEVRGYSLRSGRTSSCGCWRNEAPVMHGHCRRSGPSREYNSWVCMRRRCQDEKHHKYKNYGARGIQVCERWQVFENFLADMGMRPEGCTLDRRDNDGNYEPGNCQWAAPKEQAQNRQLR